MIEGQRVAAFVFDTLKNDAAFASAVGGRIYRDLIPQAATLPAAIVTLVSDTDVVTIGADRVFGLVMIDVHLVAAGGAYSPINGAADRADALLSNRSGENGGAHVVELRRSQAQAYLEVESGSTFAHLIQTFTTEAYAA